MTKKRQAIESIYPLSLVQQGILFHSLYAVGQGMYLRQMVCTLEGPLNISAFQQAWSYVIERHAVFRTAFVWEQRDTPLQAVYRQINVPWTIEDWRGINVDDVDQRLETFLKADRDGDFHLAHAPLMRLALFRIGVDTYRFVWTHHHLLLDGWSLPIVLNEVFQGYEKFAMGQHPNFPRVRPLRDYIAWLKQQNLADAAAYWRKYLAGVTDPTPLGIDLALRSDAEPAYSLQIERNLSLTTSNALRALARQNGLTLNTLLQGAWALLLSWYSATSDVVFGVTVSGRPPELEGIETMVGLFINTLPMRAQISPDQPLLNWLQQLQNQQAEMRQYEYTPLVEIQGWSQMKRGTSLFESIVVFENYPMSSLDGDAKNQQRLVVSNIWDRDKINYPLVIVGGPSTEILIKVLYNPQRFEAASIERLMGHLQTLLEEFAAHPHQQVKLFTPLNATEQRQLLVDFNPRPSPAPASCLHELVATQAQHNPDAIAVSYAATHLTYQALDRYATHLAQQLRAAGVRPGVRVGLCLERSPELVIAVLAVLKAGGAYLPLDPTYPAARLSFMISDAQLGLLLTQAALRPHLPATSVPVWEIDPLLHPCPPQPAPLPTGIVTPDDLAYLIYTSGSTGQPKGVLLSHRGIGPLVETMCNGFAVTAASRVLQFASFSFDAALAEMAITLSSGATLVLAPAAALLPGPDLLALLHAQAVTNVILPPSALAVLPLEPLPTLTALMVAGEACPLDLLQRWQPGRRCVNGYGPTEMTVCTSLTVVPPGASRLLIGPPLPYSQAYVLDRAMRPVPTGVSGELYLGGTGMAWGYTGQPDRTAASFVPHPFSTQPGARLYRSGDRARWHADGQLEILGRMDQQVKLRGFRIEVGEIETVLIQHPSVRACAVVGREDSPGDKRLVAYVVSQPDVDAGPAIWRAFLKEQLPDYMVPTTFVVLDELPLLPNGKVDRAALPAPAHVQSETSDTYVAPRTPIEEILVQAWAEVLRLEQVGVYDNFFTLGGHSLLATQIISRVRAIFKNDIPIRLLFEAPTVAEIANEIESRWVNTSSRRQIPFNTITRPDNIPLSFAQQRLWFLDQLEPDRGLYNLPIAFHLHGMLDREALTQSLTMAVERHEALRTTFVVLDGTPVQIIAPPQPVLLAYEDLRDQPVADKEAFLKQRLFDEARRPFQLDQGPLLRACLFQSTDEDYVLLITMHHIITDGWSIDVLLKELQAFYTGLVCDIPTTLPPLPIQYADYALWQREWLQGETLAQQVAYWQQHLAGAPVLELPTDFPRPPVQSFQGARHSFILPADLHQSLITLARKEGVTLFMALLATWAVVLARYSGQRDLVIGTPIANRTRAEIEPLIGFFVNTLALRLDLSANPGFATLLRHAREVCLNAYAHQDVPFEQVVEAVQPARDLSRHPLFQVFLAVQNAAAQPPQFPAVQLSPLDVGYEMVRFDLSLMLVETPQGLQCLLEYSSDLFTAETIARMAGHFQTLLAAAVSQPQQPVLTLPMLTPAEQTQLAQFAAPHPAPPSSLLVPLAFAQQVARTPDACALSDGSQQLSFRGVYTRAARLAQRLVRLGVRPETHVALCCDRALDYVVALLAVWQAGGAVVPLDPSHPPARLAAILADARPLVLITQPSVRANLPSPAGAAYHELCLSSDDLAPPAPDLVPPPVDLQPQHLAYLIYTSGSTGTPKAVLVEHRHLRHLLAATQQQFPFAPGDRMPWMAASTFDIAFFELWAPLLAGASVLLLRREQVLDLPALLSLLRGCTAVHAVPSLLQQIVQALQLQQRTFPQLRLVWVGGDTVPPALLPAAAQVFPQATLHVLYGPTEATILSSAARISPTAVPPYPVIGQPLPGVELSVRDALGELVPLGVPGELYIGGPGVARGYWQQPALTATRFSAGPQTRWYRSGDRVRWRPDGILEFLGRIDQQVKLRGFRIEVGEIEAVLQQHPQVQEGVVQLQTDAAGTARLVAYGVPHPSVDASAPTELATAWRQYLFSRLPDYMVPSAVLVLPALPLTRNGKVDRAALPRADFAAGTDYVAPRTMLETTLSQIWVEVLDHTPIGIYDNFFAIGGHSLLATQVATRVQQQLATPMPLRWLFETPTIAELAARLAPHQSTTLPEPTLVPRARPTQLPLSFAQQRLWFLHQLEPDTVAYHMPSAFRLQGPLDMTALTASLSLIMARHEALRTTFVDHEGSPVQVIAPPQPVVLPVDDLRAYPLVEREAILNQRITDEAQQPFHLAQGPLVRFRLLQLADAEYVLLLTFHHIIADGWSMGIFMRELSAFYTAYQNNKPAELAPLSIQYADYALWQREWLQGETLAQQLTYWQQHLAGAPVLELPTDFPRPPVQSFRGAIHSFVIPLELAQQIAAFNQKEGVTLFMTLLAAWAVVLARYSGQRDLVIGTPIANRTRAEIEPLIGFFVNTLALRLDLSANPGFATLLRHAREVCLNAYAHQDVPFEQVVEAVQPARDLSRHPLFQVFLAVQNVAAQPPQFPAVQIDPLDVGYGMVKFDLSLMLAETPQGLQCLLEYSSDLFTAETIARMAGHFQTLLAAAVSQPQQPVLTLPMLTPAEQTQLARLAAPHPAPPSSLLVPLAFAQQVARTPDACALSDGSQQLSFRGVYTRAARLAQQLMHLGVRPETHVALCCDRALDYVVALLAVWQAGGAAVPLDPSHPPARLAAILTDARPLVLITQPSVRANLPSPAGAAYHELCLSSDDLAPPAPDLVPPPVDLQPQHLAYLIYTSGSTGTPKAVLVEHRHLRHLLAATQQQFPFAPGDRMPWMAASTFDIAFFELWAPLLAGASVLLLRREQVLDLPALLSLLRGCTAVHAVPSLLQQIVQALQLQQRTFPQLRLVWVGGDTVPPALLPAAAQVFPQATLHVLYGPTEATILSSAARISPTAVPPYPVIGQPLPGVELSVRDALGELVPLGVPGELYIGGPGVARGYWQQPALTATRFSAGPQTRWYRSGDRVRWRPDGILEFLGRIDQQVKLRGFRIEVGEIEAVLQQHPQVQEGVVQLQTDAAGTARLVAYGVPHPSVDASAPTELATAWRQYLFSRLPDYMVPSAVLVLPALPLTRNGKVDRAALPRADFAAGTDYVAPRTMLETTLSQIWVEVLDHTPIGIYDNFFAIGGHSLLATQVATRVQQQLATPMPLRWLFETPTIAELAARLAPHQSTTLPEPTLAPRARPAQLPLSFAQQRLWFLHQLEPDTVAYHMPLAFRLQGPLDVAALTASLSLIMARHEALRTTFVAHNGDPVQVIAPPQPVVLPVDDLRSSPLAEREAIINQLITDEAQQPFHLAQGPLVRFRLLQLADTEYVLLLTLHHIIADGWSIRVLLNELAISYTAYHYQTPVALDPLPIQYADYALWQREWLQGETLAQQLTYWQQHLAGAPVLELPTDFPRPPVQSFAGDHYHFRLPAPLSQALSTLSQQEGCTLFMTLLTAFSVLLARLSGQADLVVGTPIANRNRQEVEGLIGFFVNTLALRLQLPPNASLRALLQQTRSVTLGAYEHQDLPFEQLVEALALPRDLSRHPLFQINFALQNVAQPTPIMSDLAMSFIEVSNSTTKFDLSLTVAEDGEQLVAALEYSTKLFAPETIARIAHYFQTVLTAMVANPDQTWSSLPLLSAAEQAQIVEEWNADVLAVPPVCLHDRVAEQARYRPEMPAVVYAGNVLTYGDLDLRANQLAHLLQSRGVQRETLVALCLERSPELIIAQLAVLKAGGAYLPLDPEYPRDRLRFMLDDAQPLVLITTQSIYASCFAGDEAQAGGFASTDGQRCQVVYLDTDQPSIAAAPSHAPISRVTPENLAYVIYTSGSTGRPKGVMVPHRGAVNLSIWHQQTFAITPEDRATQIAGLGFDATVWEVWPYLTCGATIYLVPKDMAVSPVRLQEWLIDQAITVSFIPTPLTELLLDLPWPATGTLRYLLTGGDKLRRYPAAALPFTLVNNYGPTEYSVVTTSGVVLPDGEAARLPSLGRPIANTQVYLLDEYLQVVPIGTPGELYVSGIGLSRGYLHRPDLTAERFVANPFSKQPGARLYRTGDLCRYRADGSIEFLGRVDDQVKLRGFRIELAEIETVLYQHPTVQACAVTLREDTPGNQRLVAYVVVQPGTQGTPALWQAFLKEQLPAYMVPAVFMVLDALPLNPNGKLDRKALPKPDAHLPGISEDYVAPRTPEEEILAQIWSEVLQIDQVGIYDNFFTSGGHSLLATQYQSRVKATFGVEIALRHIFEMPTIASLATHLNELRYQAQFSAQPPLKAQTRPTRLPLSFAQQRLWFLDQFETKSTAYNLSLALCLSGELAITALEQSLTMIVARHEVLRTTFAIEDGEPSQIIAPPQPITLNVQDLRHLPAAEREAEVLRQINLVSGRPFDLRYGPLIRNHLFQLADDEHVLLLTMHHIIFDGWSMGILMQELSLIYTSLRQDIPVTLDPLPIQYADYALWQREWLQGETLAQQLAYWQQHLDGAPVLELPTDFPRPPVQSFAGDHYHFRLPAGLTQALSTLSQQEGCTLFMTLLTAFTVLLARLSGQGDLVVGTPIANRNRQEVEGLIGFFVNTLALRLQLPPSASLRALLQHARSVTLGAYEHQDLPFEQLVDAIGLPRDLSRHPLFQINFALQNNTATNLDIPGLGVEPVAIDHNTSKFDLTLAMAVEGEQLVGALEYSTQLFTPATIARMAHYFQTVLTAMVSNPDQVWLDLPLLPETEERQLLVDFNPHPSPAPASCLHELVAAQAQHNPDAIAVSYAATHLTYQALERYATHLAQQLRAAGVRPGMRVGLCLERSPELVLAMLAVLKAGGAYLPLDPTYPAARLSFMISDAQIGLLLTQAALRPHLPATSVPVWELESLLHPCPSQPAPLPAGLATPDDLAYLIYTSGSTGQPKGVLLSHRGIAPLVQAQRSGFAITPASRVLQFASFSFDAALAEIAVTLSSGATLVLASAAALLPGPDLLALLDTQAITHLTLPPSALAVLPLEPLPTLTTLVVAGEACPPDLLQRWQSGRRCVNAYGPTEMTVCTNLAAVPPAANRLLIGPPLDHSQAYVLDSAMHPVPIGVSGELYLGGTGMAWGYTGHPDRTAASFVPHPFSTQPGARLYRSGDRARWHADGQLEILGRMDQQVKLRGFRIEVGEIEAVLIQHPSVRACAVVGREDSPGDKRLVAYVVPVPDTTLQSDDLRSHLQQFLPDYMLPSIFVALDELPLTPNGKVDRRALPSPDSGRLVGSTTYVPPRTPIEMTLAQIWAKVLRLERVGITDNFFMLGGDSILCIQVVSQAREHGIFLTPRQIFQHQTIAELASVASSAPLVTAEQGLVEGDVLLTPIQRWFFERPMPKRHHFNQTMLLEIRRPFTPSIIAQALERLLQQHDALRLRFIETEHGWRQITAAADHQVPLTIIDLTEKRHNGQLTTLSSIAAEQQASLNLSDGPVVRAVYFILDPKQPALLLLIVHHLVIDAVSWGILLSDLETACEQLSQEQPLALPAKTTAFKYWAERLTEYASSATLRSEEQYWLDMLRLPAPRLPKDWPEGSNSVGATQEVVVTLDTSATTALLSTVPPVYQTQINDVLLTALVQTFAVWTKQPLLLLDIESHGREDLFEDVDLTRTVGWFTSMYPVILDLRGINEPGPALKSIKEQLRHIPHHGIGYGVLRYLRNSVELAKLPSAEISFNYLGQSDQRFPSAGAFIPSNLSVGSSLDPQSSRTHLIDISGMIVQGQLQLIWSYSAEIYQQATIERLAHTYIQALRDLITHCQSPEAGGFTPSDFPLADIDQTTLDQLSMIISSLDSSEESSA